MKSTKNNTSTIEEDANILKFRRRNKIFIISLLTFFVSLTLIIGALIFHLVHNINSDWGQSTRLYPAMQSFYSASACNTPSCIQKLNSVIRTRSITDPNQIFILFLQTAARELKNITQSNMLNNSGPISDPDTELAFRNCSGSLLDGSDLIREVLMAMRANPFVEKRSNEQREELMERIVGAVEDLESCVDDLMKVGESTAVSEVMAKVHGVKVDLSSCVNFVERYDQGVYMLYSHVASTDWRNMLLNNLFIVFMFGLQLLVILSMFILLFRSR